MPPQDQGAGTTEIQGRQKGFHARDLSSQAVCAFPLPVPSFMLFSCPEGTPWTMANASRDPSLEMCNSHQQRPGRPHECFVLSLHPRGRGVDLGVSDPELSALELSGDKGDLKSEALFVQQVVTWPTCQRLRPSQAANQGAHMPGTKLLRVLELLVPGSQGCPIWSNTGAPCTRCSRSTCLGPGCLLGAAGTNVFRKRSWPEGAGAKCNPPVSLVELASTPAPRAEEVEELGREM